MRDYITTARNSTTWVNSVTCYYYVSFVIECTAKNLICMAFKYLLELKRSSKDKVNFSRHKIILIK